MAPLDVDRLLLLCDNNRTEAHELLQMAVESVRTLLTDIAAARERNDATALKHALHDLRGTTGNVGATELASLAGTLDDQVRGGKTTIVASDLTELRLALTRLEAATREFAP